MALRLKASAHMPKYTPYAALAPLHQRQDTPATTTTSINWWPYPPNGASTTSAQTPAPILISIISTSSNETSSIPTPASTSVSASPPITTTLSNNTTTLGSAVSQQQQPQTGAPSRTGASIPLSAASPANSTATATSGDMSTSAHASFSLMDIVPAFAVVGAILLGVAVWVLYGCCTRKPRLRRDFNVDDDGELICGPPYVNNYSYNPPGARWHDRDVENIGADEYEHEYDDENDRAPLYPYSYGRSLNATRKRKDEFAGYRWPSLTEQPAFDRARERERDSGFYVPPEYMREDAPLVSVALVAPSSSRPHPRSSASSSSARYTGLSRASASTASSTSIVKSKSGVSVQAVIPVLDKWRYERRDAGRDSRPGSASEGSGESDNEADAGRLARYTRRAFLRGGLSGNRSGSGSMEEVRLMPGEKEDQEDEEDEETRKEKVKQKMRSRLREKERGESGEGVKGGPNMDEAEHGSHSTWLSSLRNTIAEGSLRLLQGGSGKKAAQTLHGEAEDRGGTSVGRMWSGKASGDEPAHDSQRRRRHSRADSDAASLSLLPRTRTHTSESSSRSDSRTGSIPLAMPTPKRNTSIPIPMKLPQAHLPFSSTPSRPRPPLVTPRGRRSYVTLKDDDTDKDKYTPLPARLSESRSPSRSRSRGGPASPQPRPPRRRAATRDSSRNKDTTTTAQDAASTVTDAKELEGMMSPRCFLPQSPPRVTSPPLESAMCFTPIPALPTESRASSPSRSHSCSGMASQAQSVADRNGHRRISPSGDADDRDYPDSVRPRASAAPNTSTKESTAGYARPPRHYSRTPRKSAGANDVDGAGKTSSASTPPPPPPNAKSPRMMPGSRPAGPLVEQRLSDPRKSSSGSSSSSGVARIESAVGANTSPNKLRKKRHDVR